MATRDRTGLFLSIRAACGHDSAARSRFSRDWDRQSGAHRSSAGGAADDGDDEDRQALLSGSNRKDVAIEMDTLPPRWLDVQDEVDEELEKIRKLCAKLEPLHKKHALPGFEDRSQEEREIERLTNTVTLHFKKCNELIKRIEAMSARPGSRDVDRTMCRNVTLALASKISTENGKFRKSQSAYLARLRKSPAGIDSSSRTNRAALEDEEANFGSTHAGGEENQSQAQQQQQRQRRGKNDAAIRQREKEIDEIARSIAEVAEIFNELQGMVIEQGTLVDRIDYNIDVTYEETKVATKELATASDLQRRTRKRKLMLLLVLLIVGVILRAS
ncbi:t-SNARE affecting a late Golgi compartment protein 2 [Savitreella phatthalungensis]